MMRVGGTLRVLVAVAAWPILASTLCAQIPNGPNPLTLEAALARALEANPAILAARMRRAVDLAGIQLARERPYPEARVEVEREAPKQSFALGVPIETAGKRARRISAGEATLRTGEAELTVTILEVRLAVRRAYFARVAADARLALLEELRGLATRARDAARDRFQLGSAPRLEVVQAELTLAQTDNDADVARATSGSARVQLNALLGLPLDAPSTLLTPLDAGAVMAREVAVARAEATNVELALFSRRIEEQQAKIALARALQTPDVIPEGTITHDSQPEFNIGWRAAVAVAVPLFTRHRAAVRIEEATLTQLIAERTAALARITGEVAANAALAEAQRQQYVRYRDEILPQALDVERMAEDSYRLGQTGISAFLQALQTTRDARLRALQAALDFQTTLADLERAIGAPTP
jgi:cobalt-zinc-cadmium efflux system outer membrane protein